MKKKGKNIYTNFITGNKLFVFLSHGPQFMQNIYLLLLEKLKAAHSDEEIQPIKIQ